ncbi:MAG: UDP-4-amino-4,6-dideoxy-N-acetyl-beta-L-altrosamine transaminase, partial [Deltaproteobacteria bacterium]|nr:UDP-4-amino-4,6-dideoxy-N-acetyl-beta-L-altrosamine transaminase [Deltaproteobacteria bacterium]
ECERNKALARKIHVSATRDIVEALQDRDIKLIYISTDAVYDGGRGHFSEETDGLDPKNQYGITKLEGEQEVLRKEGALILRTNIFGWNIQNKRSLGEWVLQELTAGKGIKGFQDARFSTIYTMELAHVIDLAIERNLAGVFNCGASDVCSKYAFAQKIAGHFGLDKTLITPISIDDGPFEGKRGKDLSLDVSKLENALGYALPSIDYSVERFYRDFMIGLPERIGREVKETREENREIPYGRQWIDRDDIEAVSAVLSSPLITTGPKVQEFEKAVADFCGARYGIAVNSGTSALHMACLAAGIGHGDEVITSPNTFVASANCAVYCGAIPVFADIGEKTYNISPAEIEKKITEKTKAVIPVHFAGQSCDMQRISGIVKEAEKRYGHRIFIIEDACHALGSKYRGREVGSCTYSDMAVMSFHPVKHITTGEGGIVLSNDEAISKKLRKLRSHGITSSLSEFEYKDIAAKQTPKGYAPGKNPWWYYEQQELGFNYRITDIQGALGISQLKKLERFRRRRRIIVDRYNEAFGGMEYLQTPFESEDCDSNFHLYVLLFDFEEMGLERPQFIIELKKRGIQSQVHYIPVHTQPFFQKRFSTKWGDYPKAENYYRRCLSIPLFSAMTHSEANRVIQSIGQLVQESDGQGNA